MSGVGTSHHYQSVSGNYGSMVGGVTSGVARSSARNSGRQGSQSRGSTSREPGEGGGGMLEDPCDPCEVFDVPFENAAEHRTMQRANAIIVGLLKHYSVFYYGKEDVTRNVTDVKLDVSSESDRSSDEGGIADEQRKVDSDDGRAGWKSIDKNKVQNWSPVCVSIIMCSIVILMVAIYVGLKLSGMLKD